MKVLQLYLTKNFFFDSTRFMESSLLNLLDNLTEWIYTTKCKYCDCFLEYESVKDSLIKYEYLSCNKDCSNKIDKELKKRSKNGNKFSNSYINKIILLLKKVVYSYEYMDDWENFNERPLPEKEKF